MYLRNFGAIGPRTINKVYSSPEDVKVKITKKRVPFKCKLSERFKLRYAPALSEATVWVEVGKQKSNEVKKKIDLVM